MQSLLLKSLGPVRGIYGPKHNEFGARNAFMHPEAAKAFIALNKDNGQLPFSDILRGADESLAACKAGRGSQPPGYSGHNFGLSFDIDVETVLREKHWSYEKMAGVLAGYGFYGYRQDHSRGSEDWHFNYLGSYAQEILRRTSARSHWQNAANEIILAYYPEIVPLSPQDIQGSLKKLGIYTGHVDGAYGMLTTAAVETFCKAWSLANHDVNDARFQRTLAFIAADRTVVA